MPQIRTSRQVLRQLRVMALAFLMLAAYVVVRVGFANLAHALFRT